MNPVQLGTLTARERKDWRLERGFISVLHCEFSQSLRGSVPRETKREAKCVSADGEASIHTEESKCKGNQEKAMPEAGDWL